MLNSTIYLGGAYFVSTFVFSLAYYFAWLKSSDAFIVHQEMNLRPLTLWKKTAARLRADASPPLPRTEETALDEVYKEYANLATEEGKLQAEIDNLTPQLEQASRDTEHFGKLHNRELSDNTAKILREQQEQGDARMNRILNDLKENLAKDPSHIQEASAAADQAIRAEAETRTLSAADVLSQASATSHLDSLNTAL